MGNITVVSRVVSTSFLDSRRVIDLDIGTYFIIVGLDSLTRQDSSGYAWLCLGATCAGQPFQPSLSCGLAL
eukprot:1899381-Amphidinium_carterae.2